MVSVITLNTSKFDDESHSHCVSEWGFDFRPSYRNLAELRKWLPGIPIVAVTATAAPIVQEDVIRSLDLWNPLIAKASFDRPNIQYAVLPRSNPSDVVQLLLSKYAVHESFPSTLVYVSTKSDAELVTSEINRSSLCTVGAACYHSGLNPQQRSLTQRMFASDDIKAFIHKHEVLIPTDKLLV